MSTAISYASESGDHYLSLYGDIDNIESIVKAEKREYGDEFSYFYIKRIKSFYIDEKKLEKALDYAIDNS
tara:strand:+ start:1299 stop:1508 length:210 start_codon:yes stop_codon:yes gene_type:complete